MSLKNLFIISRQKVILWLTFVLTIILIPTHPVRAQFGIEILTAPFVFLAKLGTMLVLAMPLSFFALELGQIFLSWASNPALVGGITHNEFVVLGWRTVRDFANLFFILIMVAIGIATALRIKQYEVRKTLPRLVIVAILINFSPVICGIFIDAANIIMNFFFTAGSGGFSEGISLSKGSWEFLKSSFNSIGGMWSEILTGKLFFKMIFVTIFNFFGTFILFLMGMLFLMRSLALWLLVILSPLAFLSAVLPSTQKLLFSKWRDQFIKWTFVGVSGAFFIYLSQLMMHVGVKNSLLQGQLPATEVSQGGGNIITNLMIMAVPFMFLLIGYFATVSSSAMGASAVVGLAKKGGKWAYGKTGAKTVQSLRESARETVETSIKRPASHIAKGVGNTLRTQEERQVSFDQSRGLRRAGKLITRGLVPYATREKWKLQLQGPAGEGDISKVEKEKAKADKIKTVEALQVKHIKDKQNHNFEGQIANIKTAAEKGLLDNFSEADIRTAIEHAGAINKKLAEEIMQFAPNIAQRMYGEYHRNNPNIMAQFDMLNEQREAALADGFQAQAAQLKRQMDRIKQPADRQGLWMSTEDRQRYGTLEEKIVLTTKTKDAGKFRKDYVNDRTGHFMEIIQDANHQGRRAWSGSNLSKMAEEYGTATVDLYNETSDRINQQGNWMQEIVPGQPHHVRKFIRTSPGATAAGYRLPTDQQQGGNP